ncbi:hypothetical protein DFS33DRAFT_139734 [Desarmillaria ectypa]|nr:hypothetical protein DFS33DRAFT_139734 [Desarmillaria ectypa]
MVRRSGCCPIGEYCGTWGGLLGCCPNGETCVANDSQECGYVGYTLCSGEDFCCPIGDLCYRDSTGSPACSNLSGGGTSSLISSALGTTFVSGTTKAAVTSATVSRSSSSVGFTTNAQAGTTSSPTSVTRSAISTATGVGNASLTPSISSAASSQTTGLSSLGGGNGAGTTGVSFNIFALAVCSTFSFIVFY